MTAPLRLFLRPETLSVVRLSASEFLPVWAFASDGIAAAVRRGAELSVVCRSDVVPADATAEHGWRALEVEGPLEFSLTGVLASLADPLAAASIPIFVLSTYDTDLVLVRSEQVDTAADTLEAAGHRVSRLS
jgi:hypothetical protein